MQTAHRTIEVDGVSVFYREAGNSTYPKLLVLGGFLTSLHQFRDLLPALGDRFHVLSPDYPGFARPGAHRVQLDLLYDYRENVALYPRWQAFLREEAPKTLIPWGERNIIAGHVKRFHANRVAGRTGAVAG